MVPWEHGAGLRHDTPRGDFGDAAGGWGPTQGRGAVTLYRSGTCAQRTEWKYSQQVLPWIPAAVPVSTQENYPSYLVVKGLPFLFYDGFEWRHLRLAVNKCSPPYF